VAAVYEIEQDAESIDVGCFRLLAVVFDEEFAAE
jgi:hypothetical protein